MNNVKKCLTACAVVLAGALLVTSCDLFQETVPSRAETETGEIQTGETVTETDQVTTEDTEPESTETSATAETDKPTSEETAAETSDTEETETETTAEPATEETTAEPSTEPTTEETTAEETTAVSETSDDTPAVTETEQTEPATSTSETIEPETTAEATEPQVPALSEQRLTAEARTRLDEITNEPAYGWWYRRPAESGQHIPATIDPGIERILAAYDGIWTKPVEGRRSIYLTMDLGYEYEDHTTRILDIAQEKGVKLNFFITGSFIDDNPELVIRMTNEGHLIANHTNFHLNQPLELESGYDRLESDIVAAAQKYRNLTGREFSPFMRPPEGKYSQRSLAAANELGYRPVMWSFAYRDWETDNQPDPVTSLQLVTGEAFDGSVILLHSVSATNVEILSDVIDQMRAASYEFYRLDQ